MPTIIKPNELTPAKNALALTPFEIFTLTPRLSQTAQSEHMAFDIRKLPAQKYSYPYHFHHNAEELIYVISGAMTVRTPEGLQTIHQGEFIFFEMGETSAHQFYNHTEETCEYLDIRTTVGMDISEYPDSGKLLLLSSGEVFEKESTVDYNKGEEHVEQIWEDLKKSNA